MRLKGIVTREHAGDDLEKRASLLRKDSRHGRFARRGRGRNVEAENALIMINGHTVKMISAKTPAEVDYTAYGINDAILIDNTGVWRDEKGLSEHLEGAQRARKPYDIAHLHPGKERNTQYCLRR